MDIAGAITNPFGCLLLIKVNATLFYRVMLAKERSGGEASLEWK